ncbi:RagB/SusD family nutrient uptake outer membrane protein [Negadavirga shengliensis]|uniref:RagB/SusD family nutrient uptake outer membrane protein n=1 Tax=Negadavirga shengliensis TaxID=1389218 RepID=A0ABV9SZ16_9BACT
MKSYIKSFSLIILLSGMYLSCGEEFLEEIPLDRFSPENLLVNEAGYDAAVVALYRAARLEHSVGGVNFDYMNLGTDLVEWGRPDGRGFKDYTLLNPQSNEASSYWDWAYKDMIRQCNLILDDIDNPELDISEAGRDNVSGQAKFFRGYTYNVLVNLYGGVPIVDQRLIEPRFDFTRTSREEVLRFIANDLEEAGQELPPVSNISDGRIYQGAAYHLLSEVYISLGLETGDQTFYEKAVEAASKVINGETGHYQLMTERFGDLSKPGDVFSDLFRYNQQNRSSGNLEVIWAWQFEAFTIGGGEPRGNNSSRLWGPEQERIRSPNGINNLFAADSLNRGIGVMSLLNYWKYDIWQLDPDDMRNSRYNVRRDFYYNNPADEEYFGRKVLTGRDAQGRLVVAREDGSLTDWVLDTLRMYYPWISKIDGRPFADDPSAGQTANDFIKMRLAETYLLRAEAYFRSGDPQRAADDINVVRSRANAVLIGADQVDIDFILDERARELVVEEPRMRTLIRMGLLYDRVMRYNYSSATTVQPHNNLWPIPQSFIDANVEARIEQNPGYPGGS